MPSSQLADPFSYFCVTNSSLVSRILRNFIQAALDFAALDVGNISHHTFNMDTLGGKHFLHSMWHSFRHLGQSFVKFGCVKSRGLLKTNAHRALY